MPCNYGGTGCSIEIMWWVFEAELVVVEKMRVTADTARHEERCPIPAHFAPAECSGMSEILNGHARDAAAVIHSARGSVYQPLSWPLGGTDSTEWMSPTSLHQLVACDYEERQTCDGADLACWAIGLIWYLQRVPWQG